MDVHLLSWALHNQVVVVIAVVYFWSAYTFSDVFHSDTGCRIRIDVLELSLSHHDHVYGIHCTRSRMFCIMDSC